MPDAKSRQLQNTQTGLTSQLELKLNTLNTVRLVKKRGAIAFRRVNRHHRSHEPEIVKKWASPDERHFQAMDELRTHQDGLSHDEARFVNSMYDYFKTGVSTTERQLNYLLYLSRKVQN